MADNDPKPRPAPHQHSFTNFIGPTPDGKGMIWGCTGCDQQTTTR